MSSVLALPRTKREPPVRADHLVGELSLPIAVPLGNCHPSYPGVCIPPAPPDLDCGEIAFRRFAVVPPDSSEFDGDKDGIGCES